MSQGNHQGPLRPYGVTHIYPPAPALDVSGRVSVKADVTANVTQVAAWIYRNIVDPSLDPPDYAPRKLVSASPVTIDNVGGAEAPVGSSSTNNTVWVWSSVNGFNWQRTPLAGCQFDRASAAGQVAVPAKACIWFAYAPVDYLGPEGVGGQPQESGDDYRPVALVIPTGAKKVTLSPAGMWRHDPNPACESDADGLGNVQSTVPAYRAASYRSRGIQLLSEKLNKLVGLWEFNFQVPQESAPLQQLVLGKTPGQLEIPQGATRLFLAHHDSYEWDNNSGSVNVDVTWHF